MNQQNQCGERKAAHTYVPWEQKLLQSSIHTALHREQTLRKGEIWRELSSPFLSLTVSATNFLQVVLLFYKLRLFISILLFP